MNDRTQSPLPYESRQDSKRRKHRLIRLDTTWDKIVFAICVPLVLFVFALPIWILAPKRSAYQSAGYMKIEEVPRPMIPAVAWGKLKKGMSEKQVRMLLGEPDWTMGPFTTEFRSGTIRSTDPRTGETTTHPSPATTYTTATSKWEYTRPTSRAPQFVYRVEFDHGVVVSFVLDRGSGAPSTTDPVP